MRHIHTKHAILFRMYIEAALFTVQIVCFYKVKSLIAINELRANAVKCE